MLNPLHTNLFRKGQSLRKTKTDKVDAASIAMMLLTDRTLKPYSDISYHNEELKSLTRYRFDKVQERAKLKTAVSRLVTILFPELEQLVPTLHMTSVYALLSEFPGASFLASAHLTRLKHLLHKASKGHYGRDMAVSIRKAAASSIGSILPAKSKMIDYDTDFTAYPGTDKEATYHKVPGGAGTSGNQGGAISQSNPWTQESDGCHDSC